MSIQRTAYTAVLAANDVAHAPGTMLAQRLAALQQLKQHVEGLIAKIEADAGNPPARDTGD